MALQFIAQMSFTQLAKALWLGVFGGRGSIFWLQQTTLYIHIVSLSDYVVRKKLLDNEWLGQ